MTTMMLSLGELMSRSSRFGENVSSSGASVDPDRRRTPLAAGRFRSIPGRLPWVIGSLVALLHPECRGDELASIVGSYRDQKAAITSLHVEYRSTASALGTPSEIVRGLHMTYLPETRQVLVFKGDMRYSTLSSKGVYNHLTERDARGKPAQIKIVPGGEWAYNGSATYVLDGSPWRSQPAGLISLPSSMKGGDGGMFDQTYLKELLRALPDISKSDPDRYMFSLIELNDRSLLRLRATRAKVQDAECVGIEWPDERDDVDAGGNKLRLRHVAWCDPSLNYAVRRHDMFCSDGRTLVRQVICDDFRQIIPGVWYPQRIVADECPYPSGRPKDLLGKPLIRYTLVVENIHANDVPDAIFTPKIPPGTLISDGRFLKNTQPIVYKQPADETDLDRIISGLVSDAGGVPPSKSAKLTTFVLLNGLAVGGILVFLWMRRHRSGLRVGS
jgi:hypothetical protein